MSKVIGIGTPVFNKGDIEPDSMTPLSVSSGNGSNVYGSYAEILADVGVDDIYLTELIVNQGITAIQIYSLAIGAGGSEVNFTQVGGHLIVTEKVVDKINLGHVRVPAGSRLAIRVKDEGVVTEYFTYLNYVKE